MQKYRTSNGYTRFNFSSEIKEIEIERETEKSVWINGTRHLKHSDWGVFHATWTDAHHYLKQHISRRLDNTKDKLRSVQAKFDEISSMKKEG